jgi:hypothetical protein
MKQLIILAAALTIAAGQSYIGRVDTIGGTTYDWWASGNVHRLLANSPQYGIHAVWMYSASTSSTSFPDRNMRYSFYDYTTRQWNWTDADPMQSGVNVFAERAGYGAIDGDSAGLASVVAHTSSGVVLARDAAPGAGIMSYCYGPAGWWEPHMVIGNDGTHHVAMSSSGGLAYSRVRTWGNWDSVRMLDSLAYPAYAIAASKTTPSVCATWVNAAAAFYMLSESRGDTWGSRVELDPPPAFEGDTITRFSLYGLFPFFDSQGRLHIAAAVYPEVHDTAYSNPAELWHWCPDNQPQWTMIHHAGCAPENMQASIGYNAMYADRPTMGEGDDGNLYVAWEQFDSSNVEPQTDRLRAGVWAARSTNSGVSWGYGLRLTARNTVSHRFPCIIDRLLTGAPDTICVLYLKDSVAGFFVQGEGPATANPVICQFVPTYTDGVADTRHIQEPGIYKVTPTIVRGVLMLGAGYSGQSAGYRVELVDATGRKVMELHAGANVTRALAPGVYFVREEPRAVRKVLVVR